jgi:DMSO/TMAO reductase YedYZ molybdopterin-dependent catalytic subunit
MDERNEKYLKVKEEQARQAREQGTAGTHPAGADRLPPGQYLTRGFPVLDLGIRPDFDPQAWTLAVTGEVERPARYTWQELQELPSVDLVADFHCVTRWSKYDVHWRGVPFRALAEAVGVRPSTTHVVAACGDRYTTNLPLEAMMDDDVLIAYELEGKPIPLEHGGPVRTLVPKRYAWKSAKFLRELHFLDHDEPGFWETRGYHNDADPWREERFG